jgi:hypothetical protein
LVVLDRSGEDPVTESARSFATSPTSKPRTSTPNEITLQNTAHGITATFDGPAAVEIMIAWGTNILPIPAPFVDATMQDVARMVRRLWPGWAVGVV